MKRVSLLVLGLLGLACSKDSPSATLPPWQWVVTGMKPGSVAAAPSLLVCEPNGSNCASVKAGAKLSGAKLVRLERGVSDFQIDAATRLEVGEGTEILLSDAPRTIELRAGGLALTRGENAISAGPLLVKLLDRTLLLVGRAEIIARAEHLHRAELYVAQGVAAVVQPAGASPGLFQPGEGAVFETKAPPDLAAVFNGQLSRFRRSVLAVVETPPPPPTVTAPRGLGTMTARVPGTTAVVEGVRLARHRVRAVVRDGVAQTEVEEVFHNDTTRVLEGQYVFPLPADATISGLTLFVGDKPIDGELVEKKRAAAIFKGIVDDTVRPRDPALLEWVSGSKFSLKVFPIPANGSRKVVLRYQQVLAADGARQTYVYPMSFGAERRTSIDELSIDVELSDAGQAVANVTPSGYPATVEAGSKGTRVSLRASGTAPDHDFAVSFSRPAPAAAVATSEQGFVALRLRAELPKGQLPPPFQRRDRVVVLDASQSQSAESFAAAQQLAARALRALEPSEGFAVLVCDSACEAVPKSGLAPATGQVLLDALELVRARKPFGASDLAGALRAAAERGRDGSPLQIAYVGDGAASAGELSVVSITARVRESFERRRVDLRLFGVGAGIDEVMLAGLARSLAGSYDNVSSSGPLTEREDELIAGLRAPLVIAPTLELPTDVSDVAPRVLPNLRLGQEILVVGKRASSAPLVATLRGRLAGEAYTLGTSFRLDTATSSAPFVARAWAQARIVELEAAGDTASLEEAIGLSKRFRVMSRETSWLVLESEQMFADFGIPRSVPVPLGPDTASAERAGSTQELDLLELGAADGPAPREVSSGASEAPASKAEAAAPKKSRDVAEPPAPAAPASPTPAPAPGGQGGGLSGIGSTGRDDDIGEGTRLVGPRGSASIGGIEASGGALPSASRVVAGMRSGFRACQMQALTQDPGSKGSIRLTLRVGNAGEVAAVAPAPAGQLSPNLVACVVSRARRAQFEAPQGGPATLAFSVTLAVDEGAVLKPLPRPVGALGPRLSQDVASIRAGDESWIGQGQAALDKLTADLAATPSSRKRHEALVRGLLLRGRFAAALAAAERFVAADPDLAVARELLAYAAVATGDKQRAAAAADAFTENAATDVKARGRAARALEALGDEPRACAHWRALLELAPSSDGALYEALRCRTRTMDDREAALRDAKAITRPGPLLQRLLPLLESGQVPAFEKSTGSAGQFEVTIRCDAKDDCPYAIVITPTGTVFSPWTPALGRSSPSSFAFSGLLTGTYRIVLIGGRAAASGQVEVRALGARSSLPFAVGRPPTLAFVQVTMAPQGSGLGGALGKR
jgi:hypothetical protein